MSDAINLTSETGTVTVVKPKFQTKSKVFYFDRNGLQTGMVSTIKGEFYFYQDGNFSVFPYYRLSNTEGNFEEKQLFESKEAAMQHIASQANNFF